MGLLRLNRLNRLYLLGVTAGVVAIAVRRPAVGPLATLPSQEVRYGALAGAWLVGLVLFLMWQRTLWTTMGSGAGYHKAGGIGFLRLPRLQSNVRGHTVLVQSHRSDWSPLAGMRVSTALDIPEQKVELTLRVTTARDPDGRVLFESSDGSRSYVLEDGAGNLDDFFTTDCKAELIEIETPGTITVADDHVYYDVPYLPFDASALSECTIAAVRVAEQAEQASGDTRRV